MTRRQPLPGPYWQSFPYGGAQDIDAALESINATFEVGLDNLVTQSNSEVVPGIFGVVRRDTGAVLSTVKGRYEPWSHPVAAQPLRELFDPKRHAIRAAWLQPPNDSVNMFIKTHAIDDYDCYLRWNHGIDTRSSNNFTGYLYYADVLLPDPIEYDRTLDKQRMQGIRHRTSGTSQLGSAGTLYTNYTLYCDSLAALYTQLRETPVSNEYLQRLSTHYAGTVATQKMRAGLNRTLMLETHKTIFDVVYAVCHYYDYAVVYKHAHAKVAEHTRALNYRHRNATLMFARDYVA